MSQNSNSNGGIGFAGALTILFVGLKLTEVIDWSWWWVLAPLLITACIVLVLCAVIISAYLYKRRQP